MTNAQRLMNLLRVIAEEARANPEFADRIALAWEGERARGKRPRPRTGREEASPSRGRRRAPAVLDPLVIYRDGEAALRARLAELNIEELKDIVAEHGMDSRKLAMKWKDPQRVIDLIVETVRERVTKGNVFRHSPSSSRVNDLPSDGHESEVGQTSGADASDSSSTPAVFETPMRDELGVRYPLTPDERREHHRLRTAVEAGGGEQAIAELTLFEEQMEKKHALEHSE